jgi:hypothetical protein
MAAKPASHHDLASLYDGPPITLLGYWGGEYAPGWPHVTDFADEHWDQAQRDLVARYLDQGFAVPWRAAGPSYCRFCRTSNGSLERTDYVYLWPSGLAHYVREHVVRLPDSVIRHIVNRSRLRSDDIAQDWWKTATLDS